LALTRSYVGSIDNFSVYWGPRKLTESAAKLAAGDIIDTEAQMAIVSILAAPELQEFLMPGASNQLWRLTAKWIPSFSTMFAGYFST